MSGSGRTTFVLLTTDGGSAYGPVRPPPTPEETALKDVVTLGSPGSRSKWFTHMTYGADAAFVLLDAGDFAPPPDKPLMLASYDAGAERVAYVETVGVGDALPDMPIFLKPGHYVLAPLEATYRATWQVFPAPLKRLLEAPAAESPPPIG